MMIRNTTTGDFYAGLNQNGVQWTDYKPHAEFYSDRNTVNGTRKWLNSLGFQVRIEYL